MVLQLKYEQCQAGWDPISGGTEGPPGRVASGESLLLGGLGGGSAITLAWRVGGLLPTLVRS